MCHEATLGDRRDRGDAGEPAQRLDRPRRESGLGERAKPNVGPPEKVGRGAAQRGIGRGAGDDGGRHDRHAEGDADDRQRGAERAGEEPAPGERRQAHRRS